MKICFFGPLGWKKNVWNILIEALEHNSQRASECVFFEFPSVDSPNEYEIHIIDSLKNICFDVVICCSYGVNFLIHCINKYALNFKGCKVVLIDGILDVSSAQIIRQIKTERKEFYPSFDEFKKVYLDLNFSQFELSLVESIYDFSANKHIYSNNDMYLWINYIRESFSLKEIGRIKNRVKELIIFSKDKRWNEFLDVSQFVQMKEEEHLLMIDNPQIISEIINR